MTTEPRHGEWWVCCTADNAAKFGGAINVPPSLRIVALFNADDEETYWSLAGATMTVGSWLKPIKRVDLA